MIKTIANHFPLAVGVRLTARLTLESLQVTVLAVGGGFVIVTHSVSSLTRPLSIALALLHALFVLTDKSLLQTVNSYGELTPLQELTGQSVSRQHSGSLQVFEMEQVLQIMLVRSGQSWSAQH